ncbi:cupredoxin domain-containing protein [Paenibacillus turpanensis]|uniref:cupredoxin domain-containing protein n=1 Tax=Paenibacillus turpanensis TaxID=2689078 RepID=UPI00140A760A|nr:cupredoxin domain-containing protein [Paenibacillus turpanensis]
MKKYFLAVITAALMFTLAACGGGTSSEAPSNAAAANGTVVDVPITATNFKFDKEEYRFKKGDTVNLSLVNKEGVHGIDIKGLNVSLKAGQTKSIVLDKPGTYQIVCNVMCGAGHSTMVSKLIVE